MKELLMVKEIVIMNIEAELSRAKQAVEEGNVGMARVCARRACGISISFWLEDNPRSNYGESAMNQLRSIQSDDTVPKEIKDAAERLTTKVAGQTTLPFSDDPITDAKILTNHFLIEKS
jgi:hypothetical protein